MWRSRQSRNATSSVPSLAVEKLAPVQVNVVLVREPNPPEGEEPIEWMLIATLPIDTPEQIRQIVEYYCVRWWIEIFFKVLKSGCRVEKKAI